VRVHRKPARDVHKNLPLVSRLWALSYPEDRGKMKRLLRSKSPGVILLAYEKGRVVGWCFMARLDVSRFETHVYVDPMFRRQGAGMRLLQRARKEASKQHRGVFSPAWDPEEKRPFIKAGIPVINYHGFTK
jgi:GNAT superfamily N-acetyltransferase